MQFQQTGGLIPKKVARQPTLRFSSSILYYWYQFRTVFREDAYLLVLDVIAQLKSEQTMNRVQADIRSVNWNS